MLELDFKNDVIKFLDYLIYYVFKKKYFLKIIFNNLNNII